MWTMLKSTVILKHLHKLWSKLNECEQFIYEQKPF